MGDRARTSAGRRLLPLALLGPLLLSGCKEPKPAAGQAASRVPHQADVAAERAIRAAMPAVKEMQFRGVQVWSQAMPRRWAVCGQVSPFADDPALFVPFVSVVSIAGDGTATVPDPAFVATSVSEADRTYLALVTNCYDNGGPADSPMASVPPIPPLPNTVPSPSLAGAGSVAAEPRAPAGRVAGGPAADASATQPASGDITMRQNANVHASPHGPSVRVVPQGTALRIFGAAPGGWYEVGDAAPWGWVHESMFVRR